jgi:hypothetical protein
MDDNDFSKRSSASGGDSTVGMAWMLQRLGDSSCRKAGDGCGHKEFELNGVALEWSFN